MQESVINNNTKTKQKSFHGILKIQFKTGAQEEVLLPNIKSKFEISTTCEPKITKETKSVI